MNAKLMGKELINHKLSKLVAAACLALSTSMANAQSITLNYDYMATNKAGSFAGHGVSVATLRLDDFAAGGTYVDAAGVTQTNTDGGVRAIFNVNTNGLSQLSSGVGSAYISSFELNFPDTEVANGYDSAAAGGKGNNWANVSGVPLAGGGVEWQEGGATNNWGLFGQENNWGSGTGNGLMTQTSGGSTVDFFNAIGDNTISVANLMANDVANADGSLASAFSWIKIRSNTGKSLAQSGIAANGWWGDSGVNKTRYFLDVIATDYTVNDLVTPSQVPVPAALPLMGSALGLFGISRRRRNIAK